MRNLQLTPLYEIFAYFPQFLQALNTNPDQYLPEQAQLLAMAPLRGGQLRPM